MLKQLSSLELAVTTTLKRVKRICKIDSAKGVEYLNLQASNIVNSVRFASRTLSIIPKFSSAALLNKI